MNTLHACPPATDCEIAGFASDLPDELRQHLLAWGLLPGVTVRVLNQSPATRLLVEHTELAIEHSVAALIHIQPLTR